MPGERKNILFYCGGFQPVGGVESFTIDLINCLPPDMADISLALWGKPLREIPNLMPIKASAAEFHRSFFRWGCRWNLPDHLLLPAGLRMARRKSSGLRQDHAASDPSQAAKSAGLKWAADSLGAGDSLSAGRDVAARSGHESAQLLRRHRRARPEFRGRS